MYCFQLYDFMKLLFSWTFCRLIRYGLIFKYFKYFFMVYFFAVVEKIKISYQRFTILFTYARHGRWAVFTRSFFVFLLLTLQFYTAFIYQTQSTTISLNSVMANFSLKDWNPLEYSFLII